MNEAKQLLADPVRLKTVWEEAMESGRVSKSPWGLWNYITGVKDLDGNVMLYEVRTAIDYHGIFPVPDYKRSLGFERKLDDMQEEITE